ncbi:MAG: ferrous iron transport protein A [Candidatus Kapabacteria bacterium]|nr:ferrous iron transport protein A [Candidatus Kapabacteria bacterium]
MDALLGSPTHDPHGSVIPDKNGNMPDVPALLLQSLTKGQRCIIRAVLNGSSDLLSYLTRINIHLGTELTVEHIEPFDGTMNVILHEPKSRKVTLSKTVCEHLSVEVVR